MRLLTEEIRRKLPRLCGQDGRDGKAIAWVKFFTPDSSFTWHVTGGQQEGGDFICFGLVEGQFKELGYFNLSELESVRGPMGLAVERDFHWKPKPLEEIAPEMFKQPASGGD